MHDPSDIHEHTEVPRRFSRDFSLDDISRFFELFSGREKGFAEYRVNEVSSTLQSVVEPKGRVEVIYHSASLTNELIMAHLKGEKTLGYFPIKENLTVSVILLTYWMGKESDMDLDYQRSLMLSAACSQTVTLHNNSISSLLEDMGDTRLRLWIFLKRPVHFLEARRVSMKLVDAMGLSKPGVHLTPVLFTEPDGLEWAERAVLLPLAKDPFTGKRNLFIHSLTGKTYADQIAILQRIERVEIETIRKFIKSRRTINRSSRLNSNSDTESLQKRLRMHCSVFDALLRKIESGRNLTDEEKRVIFYTVGFFDIDRKALHAIFRQCPDYKEKSVERQASNLYPRPISCARIRELLPSIVAYLDCSCVFDSKHIKLGRYPSPLLHIQPELVPTFDKRYSAAYAMPREIANQYLVVMQELYSKYDELNALERELIIALKSLSKSYIVVNNICFKLTDDGKMVCNKL